MVSLSKIDIVLLNDWNRLVITIAVKRKGFLICRCWGAAYWKRPRYGSMTIWLLTTCIDLPILWRLGRLGIQGGLTGVQGRRPRTLSPDSQLGQQTTPIGCSRCIPFLHLIGRVCVEPNVAISRQRTILGLVLTTSKNS